MAPRTAPGRFVEGSMKDRASAAPPVAFLGPVERPPEAPRRTRLGMVWERLRRRRRDEQRVAERPEREHVLDSYVRLREAGFFAGRAVVVARPATAHRFEPALHHRQPPPHQQVQQQQHHQHQHHHHLLQHQQQQQLHHPQHHQHPPPWPLSPSPSPVCSPASSRGTKRAADDGDDDDEPPARRLVPKRLRRSASSRDLAALPRVRRARLVPDPDPAVPRVPAIPARFAAGRENGVRR